MMQTIFLVRHAYTAWNDVGRYLGRCDVDLDADGLSQAERLGAWAATADLDALVTSPAKRAARTAAVVAIHIGLSPRHDDRLRELDFGVAEGRTLAELRASHPDAVRRFEADPVAHPFPSGEDPLAAAARIGAAIADLLASRSVRVLVITHNTLLRLFLCDALGVRPRDYRRRFPVAEHCAVTELSASDGTFALRRFNSALPGSSPGASVRERSSGGK